MERGQVNVFMDSTAHQWEYQILGDAIEEDLKEPELILPASLVTFAF